MASNVASSIGSGFGSEPCTAFHPSTIAANCQSEQRSMSCGANPIAAPMP
jgi:hypothetical protein